MDVVNTTLPGCWSHKVFKPITGSVPTEGSALIMAAKVGALLKPTKPMGLILFPHQIPQGALLKHRQIGVPHLGHDVVQPALLLVASFALL